MGGYAGDVSPGEAWERLFREENSLLVDVRTPAEWHFVGIPDLSSLGRKPALIWWSSFPGGRLNPDFLRQLATAAPDADSTLLFLCRSGVRSLAAAMLASQAGFARAFNIAEGFEGKNNAAGHRGTTSGWKFRGLPWHQG